MQSRRAILIAFVGNSLACYRIEIDRCKKRILGGGMRSKAIKAWLSGRLWAISGFVLMGSLGVIQPVVSAPLPLQMAEPEEQGISTTRLALLDALAERYVEEGRVAAWSMWSCVTAILCMRATGHRSIESDDPQAVGFVSHLFHDQAHYRGGGHAAI